MTKINPYNFVSLPQGHPIRAAHIPRHRLDDGSFCGKLSCLLQPLTPLITLDQSSKDKLDTTLGFPRNIDNIPIIQATSLKGMIRSVYEAITHSCLVFAATKGTSDIQGKTVNYYYSELTDYHHLECKDENHLCPACRLFGALTSSGKHFQGRVSFSDAKLVEEDLIPTSLSLKGLYSPKPHFRAAYANRTDSGTIAGRKFFYHQKFNSDKFQKTGASHEITISEYADQKCKFRFQVKVENLTEYELSDLLLAIELHQDLAHKLGLGKPLGLGSCQITLEPNRSSVTTAPRCYQEFDNKGVVTWHELKTPASRLPESLIEVLRLNKRDEGEFGYSGGQNIRLDPMNALGIFDGKVVKPGRPPWPDDSAASPQESPPAIRLSPGQILAWLKEVHDRANRLIFVDLQGTEIERSKKAFQGKPGNLKAGCWFILSGESQSKRVL